MGVSSKKSIECVHMGRKCNLSFTALEYKRLGDERVEVNKLSQRKRVEPATIIPEIAVAAAREWTIDEQRNNVI